MAIYTTQTCHVLFDATAVNAPSPFFVDVPIPAVTPTAKARMGAAMKARNT